MSSCRMFNACSDGDLYRREFNFRLVDQLEYAVFIRASIVTVVTAVTWLRPLIFVVGILVVQAEDL